MNNILKCKINNLIRKLNNFPIKTKSAAFYKLCSKVINGEDACICSTVLVLLSLATQNHLRVWECLRILAFRFCGEWFDIYLEFPHNNAIEHSLSADFFCANLNYFPVRIPVCYFAAHRINTLTTDCAMFNLILCRLWLLQVNSCRNIGLFS